MAGSAGPGVREEGLKFVPGRGPPFEATIFFGCQSNEWALLVDLREQFRQIKSSSKMTVVFPKFETGLSLLTKKAERT